MTMGVRLELDSPEEMLEEVFFVRATSWLGQGEDGLKRGVTRLKPTGIAIQLVIPDG